MVHSGFGIDQFPDCHLRDIAHSGMDAILVFTKDVNTTTCGFLDFNELIVRAAKYGIDVYAYSYMKSKFHPLDDGAEEYYESTYGRLFEKCPGLKGVILVGESLGFPTRDPIVNKKNDKYGLLKLFATFEKDAAFAKAILDELLLMLTARIKLMKSTDDDYVLSDNALIAMINTLNDSIAALNGNSSVKLVFSVLSGRLFEDICL